MKQPHLVALLLFGCLSAWAAPNNQQDKENSYQTELLSGKVKIIVSFEQKEYQIGDKIPLLLTIQNDSEDTLYYDWKGYGYDGADITILYTPDQKKVKKAAIVPIFDFRKKAFISFSHDDIPPHQKYTRTIRLTHFFTITKPGNYIISLTSFLSYHGYRTAKPSRQPLKFTIDEIQLKIIEKKVENTEKNKPPHPVGGDIRDSASDRKDVSPLNSN